MIMKNVAGFHSFDLGKLGDADIAGGFRKNLGMIERHMDACTTLGVKSVEVT